jgi:hypothetical protein
MSKKQTAVDFLVETLEDNGISLDLASKIIEEAKEMEKQQMKDATLDNVTTNKGLRKIFENQFEQYYSEIYGYKEI